MTAPKYCDKKRELLSSAVKWDVLRFGEFRLKSGRVSPYFFNAGLFNTGTALNLLAKSYAAAIKATNIQFDVLFGPAYKGIPLVVATAQALASDHGMNIPYCFNRKEAKDHGEGGLTVGAPLKGKALIIDDVITAGTAVREAASIIADAGAKLAGIVIAMDRQERGADDSSALSAVQEVEQEYDTKVISIITLSDIIDYLSQENTQEFIHYLDKMQTYQKEYGTKDIQHMHNTSAHDSQSSYVMSLFSHLSRYIRQSSNP